MKSAANIGSSPQAWGTFLSRLPMQPHGRFIPTGVGNIPNENAMDSLGSVHPHRRGEHPGLPEKDWAWRGSSPQAWGTFIPAAGKDIIHRFIPTGVGNIHGHGRCHIQDSVHPHRRGEHTSFNLLFLEVFLNTNFFTDFFRILNHASLHKSQIVKDQLFLYPFFHPGEEKKQAEAHHNQLESADFFRKSENQSLIHWM